MTSYNLTQQQYDFLPKIYETVTNPAAWTETLDQLADFCGAAGCGLNFGDLANPEISSMYVSKFLSNFNNPEYLERFGKEEGEAFAVVAEYPIHTWVDDETAFQKPVDQIPSSIFQQDSIGIYRRVGTRLNETPVWIDGLAMNYAVGRSNMTPEEDSISQLFLPHIAKAIEIARPFLLLQRRYQAILNVLDHLQIGIVIVDASGGIVSANRAAEDTLSTGNGVSRTRDKRLRLEDAGLQGQLQRLVTAASETDHPKRYAPVLTAPKRDGELPWLLEVFPLSNIDGEMTSPFRGAAVFITDPARKDIISTEGLAALFGLTKAENEVCEMLTNGLRVTEVAEERNTSVDTTRSQITTLFSKTDTSSQSDLVRLALKVNLPVDRPE